MSNADLIAALTALIQEVWRGTKHEDFCRHGDLVDMRFPKSYRIACQCDWQARVDADLARRWAQSIEATIRDVVDHEEHTVLDTEQAALAAARRETAP